MNKVTNNQKEKINSVFEEAVNYLKLSEKNAEKIIKLETLFKKEISNSLKKIVLLDEVVSPFPIVEFEITIPQNYQKFIDAFFEICKKDPKILKIDLEIKSYFLRKTNCFVPGDKYLINFFLVLDGKKITIQKSIKFLHENDFLDERNIQMMFLAQSIMSEYFPKNYHILGINNKPYKNKNGYNVVHFFNRLEENKYDEERYTHIRGGLFLETMNFKDLSSPPCNSFFYDYCLIGIQKK